MSRLSNAILMLELLSNNKKYSINELARILEVSERMVRCYKNDLEMAGIYIDTIKGKYGGYILTEKNNIPKFGFSKYDIELFEKITNDIVDDELKLKSNILLEKIKGVYQSKTVKASNIDIIKAEDSEKYNVLSRAIKENKKVVITYKSINENVLERKIHPCDMYLYNNINWYVSAFCELRGEIRQFELERIKDIKLLEEKY